MELYEQELGVSAIGVRRRNGLWRHERARHRNADLDILHRSNVKKFQKWPSISRDADAGVGKTAVAPPSAAYLMGL
jgi:hypothetical protein